MRRACITIDVDSLYCYQGIYGLPVDRDDNAIYEVGLERFVDLMEDCGLRGTVFAVADDLTMGDNRRVLRYLAARGHEIGNHTLSHDYRLTKLGAAAMRREVGEGRRKLEDEIGAAVVGFRAPGYNVTDALLGVIEETGHRYDSSVFPSLPYYAAKAAVLGLMKLLGRPSHSILGDPLALAAPLGPYRPRPTAYWRRGKRRLWELPITTTPVLRLPFLGSYLVLMKESWFPILYRMLRAASDCLVLEFHAMDFMDGVADGLDPALFKQPDVAVSWETKERLYRRVFETLKEQGEVVPLGEAAELLDREADGDGNA